MIKNCAFLTKKCFSVFRTAHSSTNAIDGKWDLMAAVCVERGPIINPPLNDVEKQFKKILAEIEFEKSMKSDWEIRQEQEQILTKQGKKNEDVETTTIQTVQDFIDAAVDEKSKFNAASQTTEADKVNDITSLQRKLDKHLVLLVEKKLQNKTLFLLPQGKRDEGESLRQTAERVLKDSCGTGLKAQFLGNAPAGFYKYKYPSEVSNKNGSLGAKVFIYTAFHKEGQVDKKISKFKWLDRNELEKELIPKYHKSISAFLIDD